MKELPKVVYLCSIQYLTSRHEGLIVFEERLKVHGCHQRFAFFRDEVTDGSGMWRLQIDSSREDQSISVPHLVKAYEILLDVFGGTFESKQSI